MCIYIYTYVYTYIYIYVYVYMCVLLLCLFTAVLLRWSRRNHCRSKEAEKKEKAIPLMNAEAPSNQLVPKGGVLSYVGDTYPNHKGFRVPGFRV